MARNQQKIISLLIAIFLAVAIFFYLKPNQKMHGNQFAGNMTPKVSIIKIAKEKIVISKELPARVNAYEISEIRPEISGIIEKITFREIGRAHV